jgi:hypothetical protein
VPRNHPVCPLGNRLADKALYPLNVVLLVDEYDYPLLGNIGNRNRIKDT